nr:MAG: two-component system response regulator [Bacillota bacterium]
MGRCSPVADPPVLLVVDDQPGVRRLLETVFSRAGFQVLIAAGGAEALELARSRPPDVAILDLRMPGLDGVETLRGLRELVPGLPVVLMTAVGEDQRLAEAMRLGAREAVTKPFDVFRLLERVRILLGMQDSGPASEK